MNVAVLQKVRAKLVIMVKIKYTSKSKVSEDRRVPKKKSTGNVRRDDIEKEFWKDKDQTSDKWYYEIMDDPEEFETLSEEQVSGLKTEAKKLLENEIESYNRNMSKGPGGSDYNWLQKFMVSGTVSDKIAACTIAVQNSPVHSLPLLGNFVNMVKVGKRKECVQVLEILTELFISHLLRPDKKLRKFEECPLSVLDQHSSQNKRKTCLILWYFEDQLKELYHTFIKALNTAAHDTVENNREKAVTSMFKLLSENPEQESVLLTNLVNKLGDPSQKVASKVVYHLVQLLNNHPNMRFVVMEEIEKLLFRPNVGKKAQYYGICFLTQFVFEKEETELAKNLIRIYLSFFKACVKQGEVDSRLLSVLLTGVNRAYPFAKNDMDSMLEHIDTLYKVVHLGNFSVSVHTLTLLFQIADHTKSTLDRFYSALYKKILDPQLSTSSHQAAFLNLISRALLKDEDTNRVRVFIKRLLQVCCYLPAQMVCGILLVVSKLKKKNDNVLVYHAVATKYFGEEEEDEYYADVKCENMETEDEKDECKASTSAATWFHCKNFMNGIGKKPKLRSRTYDPYQRNPTFAGGEYCNHIELLKLAHHYHPSVVLFAQTLLQGETISYTADPLLHLTLPRFLDRFVFKNPKKINKKSAGSSVFSRKKSHLPSGMKSLRIDSAAYLNADEQNIPVDELFLYRFLQKKKIDDDESDAESVASEEFLDVLTQNKKSVNFAEEIGKAEMKKLKGAAKKRKTETSSEESESDVSESESDAEEEEEEEEEEENGEDFALLNDESGGHVSDSSGYTDTMFFGDLIAKSKKQMKGSKKKQVRDDSDDEDDGEEEYSEDEEEDDDDDDSDSEEDIKKAAKRKPKQKLKKKMKGHAPFMPAEQFAEILEERGAAAWKTTGSHSFSHKSNSEMRQMKWEAHRDFWLHKANKKKNFGTKRKWKGSAKASEKIKRFRKK